MNPIDLDIIFVHLLGKSKTIDLDLDFLKKSLFIDQKRQSQKLFK